MSFASFKERILSFAEATGASVVFRHVDGKHIAELSDGTTITGNTTARRVSVQWGSGHMAYAEL
jgi:hypothetical protein